LELSPSDLADRFTTGGAGHQPFAHQVLELRGIQVELSAEARLQ
jgi:hypothetical protein